MAETLLSAIRGVHGLGIVEIPIDILGQLIDFKGKCLKPNIRVSVIRGLDEAKLLVPLNYH